MSGDPIVVRSLLACYPPGWRRRYGDEYAALLSDSMTKTAWVRRPALVANVLRGALDAHVYPRGVPMRDRVRTPITTAVWAAGLFTVAGIGFQKMTEDPALSTAARRHAAIGWSFNLLIAAAAIALLALVAAALPTAAAMLRGRANGTLKFLAVPPLAIAAWYGVLRVALLIAGQHSVHSTRNILAACLIVVAGFGVVAGIAWAASTVLRRVPADAPARLRPAALTVIAVGMAAATIACLVWGLALHSAVPTGFTSTNGILATPLAPSWIVTTVLMATATALAAMASRRELATPTPG